jgi:acetyl esterase/lipase
MPIIVKEKSEYTPLDPNYTPGKNAHYAELDPIFAPLKPVIDAQLDQIWNPESTIDEFRKGWSANSPSPKGCPVEGEDVVTEKRTVKMRDGAEREICIYRSKEDDGKGGKALVLRCHGGGWVIGGPNTEHPESLLLAGKTNSVVVVIDYRMWVTS